MNKNIKKILLYLIIIFIIVINLNIILDKDIAFFNNKEIITEPNNMDIDLNIENLRKSLSIGIIFILSICGIGIKYCSENNTIQ